MIELYSEDRVAYIVLNMPEKRNALGPEMVNTLKSTIEGLLASPQVKVIVFKSSGSVFCSGADLAYLSEIRNFSDEENLLDSQNLRGLFDLIYNGDKIFISEVNGPALAGGCGLATICDFCFSSESAKFGYTEARIGFVPALVMVYLQNRINGRDLRELLLTSKHIDATEAKRMGLVNEVVPEKDLSKHVSEFAKKMVHEVSGNSIKYIKKMIREIADMNQADALDYAAKMNAEVRKSDDCIKGIDAFLNKDKIQW